MHLVPARLLDICDKGDTCYDLADGDVQGSQDALKLRLKGRRPCALDFDVDLAILLGPSALDDLGLVLVVEQRRIFREGVARLAQQARDLDRVMQVTGRADMHWW